MSLNNTLSDICQTENNNYL